MAEHRGTVTGKHGAGSPCQRLPGDCTLGAGSRDLIRHRQVFSLARAYVLIVPMRVYVLATLLLVCTFALQCASTESSSEAGPAGTVVAISGEVRASSKEHGDRKLAANSDVYRVDHILSSADSQIEIRLTHNGALWSLRGQRDVIVGESPAWRAKIARADLLDPASDDETGAAGRHSERQAGDVPSTLMGSGSDSDSPKEDVASAALSTQSQTAVPQGGVVGGVVGASAKGKDRAEAKAQPPLEDSFAESADKDVSSDGARPSGELDAISLSVKLVDNAGPLARSAIENQLGGIRSAIEDCVKDPKAVGKVSLHFAVSAEGTIFAESLRLRGAKTKTHKALRPCLEAALQSEAWPSATKETRVVVELAPGKP